MSVDTSLDPHTNEAQLDDVGNNTPPAPVAKEPEPVPVEPVEKTEPEIPPTGEEGEPPAADDDAPLDAQVWGDAGSEAGNAVLQLLQNSGVTTDEAKALLFDAVSQGKPEAIDRAALEAKVGKVKATLIMAGVSAHHQDSLQKAQAIIGTVHAELGGQENWDTVRDWAKANVEADQMETFKSMIDSGGLQARLAAKELKALYEAAETNSSLKQPGNAPIVPRGGKESAAPIPPLSASAYADRLEALQRNYNGNPPDNLRQALLTARQRGRNNGL